MRTALLILVVALCLMNESKVESKDTKEGKKKKNPRDYTDADIYKLEEEWTEDGDIDEGDLPEHLRKPEPVDMSKIDSNDPESLIKMTKRKKTLMMFATVSGDPTEKETDELTALWQSSLYNANIEITRFVISPNRILVKLADGSYAYEVRDFLVQQDRCEKVTIEGQDYPGKASPDFKNAREKRKKKKDKGGKKKKAKNAEKSKSQQNANTVKNGKKKKKGKKEKKDEL